MHHILVQLAVTDLNRKSIVGTIVAVPARRCELCRADGNDDAVGAMAVTERF